VRAASLCALALATSACAHLRADPSRLETVHVGRGDFRVAYGPEDENAARQVTAALPLAVAAAERWGTLSTPVLITIHPTHQALESAARNEGNGWFLAWSRHASVDLQSPRTWNGSDAEVRQILAHELTHCVVFQALRRRRNSRGRTIPVWFREGMASVSAGQEHKRVPTEAIWHFYRQNAAAESARLAADPLTESDGLWSSAPDFAYAAAHEAFQLLLERHGEERVRALLASMGDGSGFGEAFQRVMGIDVRDFEGDFRQYAVAKAEDGQHKASQLHSVAALAGVPGSLHP
jgi:hypothetical protein